MKELNFKEWLDARFVGIPYVVEKDKIEFNWETA